MRGATQAHLRARDNIHISIHAPHAGSDIGIIYTIEEGTIFQSTLPMRGATGLTIRPYTTMRHFNPRSPCGERPVAVPDIAGCDLFQSTLPMRGATPNLL